VQAVASAKTGPSCRIAAVDILRAATPDSPNGRSPSVREYLAAWGYEFFILRKNR
jgi:hypothetical protein